ncbi:hypothetical protein DFW101_1932 [Solidesulfovibrio carbinoliphilus subsp. oakridgensis]|uniref:Antitoxin Xre/MbcA/ParS-like toxin-binding domain-containing protein n=1 Tax=Solidesulfovibrio carbinoliphilus subsp. oakridgensis TaxID=694327 RepID=G7Q511_9BACT|nr:hypothetical protein DFW101_1932 [Solidesulfovibrio carbinoliphilus subsp. oakridgensis]
MSLSKKSKADSRCPPPSPPPSACAPNAGDNAIVVTITSAAAGSPAKGSVLSEKMTLRMGRPRKPSWSSPLREPRGPFKEQPAGTRSRHKLASRLLGRAAEVLGGEEQARQWLTSPNTLFDGRAPIDYAETAEGMALVLDVLGRIEYGVFS